MAHKVLKSYKFRTYPTAAQRKMLINTFGCVRFVWNRRVAAFNSYSSCGPNPRVTSKSLKDQAEFSFLNEVSATALQQKDRDFDATLSQFFNKNRKKKLGRPQFKKRGVSNDSYRLPFPKFSVVDNQTKIRLDKIGRVKMIADRKIPDHAELRSVTVSMTRTGEFYVSILVEEEIETKPNTGRVVGIDLGLNSLAVLSDGTEVHNPRIFRKNQVKLKKKQIKLKHKVRGSKRHARAKLAVSKLHLRVARQRSWFLHNLSSWLVANYDVICVEDLNVAGMKKRYGKSISDAAFSSFVHMLEYKSNWYGKTFHKIDRWFASTKTCNLCDNKQEFGLEVRKWTCDVCHAIHDRDLNAAINILKQGLRDLYDYTSDELNEVIERMNDMLRPIGPHSLVAMSLISNEI
jgi:putative transposase